MPTPKRVFLRDRNTQLVGAWEEAFSRFPNAEMDCGDFFAQPADAMVSPANSFGIMDGGIDAAIRDELGFGVEVRAQAAITEQWYGELPVGAAVIVPTEHERWPHLIVAPTMRVPENVNTTLNAYLAFRAVLVAAAQHNLASDRKIESVLCPGMCTGVGGMSPRRSAGQMRVAWAQMVEGRIPSFARIHAVHQALKTAS